MNQPGRLTELPDAHSDRRRSKLQWGTLDSLEQRTSTSPPRQAMASLESWSSRSSYNPTGFPTQEVSYVIRFTLYEPSTIGAD